MDAWGGGRDSVAAAARAAVALLWVAAALPGLGCAGTGGQVQSQPGADPSTYPSYAFAWPLGTDLESPELSERLRIAVSRELEGRGYLYDADAPAMRVNVHPLAAEEPPAVAQDPGVAVGEDFFGNPVVLDPTGQRRVRTRANEAPQDQRGLSILVIDTAEGRMVWQRSWRGWPVGEVDEATLSATVAGLLEGFPRSADAP